MHVHATNRLGEIATTKKPAAEFIGTFWLVLGGCGSAVGRQLRRRRQPAGIGLLGGVIFKWLGPERPHMVGNG